MDVYGMLFETKINNYDSLFRIEINPDKPKSLAGFL